MEDIKRLSDEEKEILLKFRLLSDEDKKEVLKCLRKEVHGQSN